MNNPQTTTDDGMRCGLKLWEEMADGLWKRKGYHMKALTLEDAYTEQLKINARTAKRKAGKT